MNLLVIRFSAMGDVALVQPALKAVLHAHPDLRITLLTRPAFVPLFAGMERVDCIGADVSRVYKGAHGLYRLYRHLKKTLQPDGVIDLHDVLRSWLLCAFFKKDGIPFYRIDKGRREKKALTRKRNKKFAPLKHSVDRYLAVFQAAGRPAKLLPAFGFAGASLPSDWLQAKGLMAHTMPWIGIAPFARHNTKQWPLEKTAKVIAHFIDKGHRLFLFGGGSREIAAFQSLQQQFPAIIIVAGQLSLAQELGLIRKLDLMLTMDSANMHLAALSGTPVFSIWGPTHPYAGFAPLAGKRSLMVQIGHDQLGCRPCSVFGNVPCFRGDHACMQWIQPAQVIDKMEALLAAPGAQSPQTPE